MEPIVTLIVGIAWPVATVWVAYMFKGELKALVARISHLKYKEIEAKFEKGLAEVEAEVQKAERITPPALPQPERLSQLDQLRRIAEVSPRAAIMDSLGFNRNSRYSWRFFFGHCCTKSELTIAY